MARRNNDRYVRYYTLGSTAAKLEREERRAYLPKYKNPQKRQPIPFDPVAFVGSAVAVLLAVLMIVGLLQVNHTTHQVKEMEAYVISLERTNGMLQEEYESGYDLNEIRTAAQAMGMIPGEEAARLPISVPAEEPQAPQVSWWDNFLMSLRQFFE